MKITADGIVTEARQIPSPNCDDRPQGEAVALLVLHNISLPPGVYGGDAIIRFFTNTLDHTVEPYFANLKGVEVSAHFLVRRDGELIQFVPCAKRAWHAGHSQWRGRERCNDFSIGIELEGSDDVPFTERQYDTLAALVGALWHSYPLREAVGHSDIAPERKTDPGPAFDWPRFRAMIA